MDAIINEYKHGTDTSYKLHTLNYENPHKIIIENLLKKSKDRRKIKGNILDLCCGNGDVSNMFEECNVDGTDPSQELWEANTRTAASQ